jgi:hypothetical protein
MNSGSQNIIWCNTSQHDLVLEAVCNGNYLSARKIRDKDVSGTLRSVERLIKVGGL